MSEKQKWFIVVIFAAAMAWVESAVVVYLRTMIDRIILYQANPLPNFAGLGGIEAGREAATLVMLLAVGWLAGKTRHDKLAYAAIAFGTWDIFYYLYLVPMSGWPQSLWDWDILFLLPLPWWGAVIAPVSIALLCVMGGTLITQRDLFPRPSSWVAASLGAVLALYTFMADAIRVAALGERALRSMLPTQFEWALFIVALALMGAPVVAMAAEIIARKKFSNATTSNA